MEPFWYRQWTVDCVDTKYRELSWKLFCRADVTARSRIRLWYTTRYQVPGTCSIRAASVKSTGQGGGVSAVIWVNVRIHGRIQTRNSDLSLYRASCIEHRASFAGSICHTPPPSKAPLGCGFYAQFQVRMLCKKELRANSGEFVPWRPTTYSESTIVCYWYQVPGTGTAAAGLADRGRTVLPTGTQQVFRYQVPGTLLVPGTRYQFV